MRARGGNQRDEATRGGFRYGLAGLLAGVVFGLAGSAHAQATYQIATQIEGWYDTAEEESLIDTRLDALVSTGPYSLGATFLSHSPSNFAALDPNDFGPQQQGLRKRWLAAENDAWRVRVGDVYGVFGRGLALNLFEDQVVDFDNAIDGFSGSGRFDRFDIEILGGTNTFGDPYHVIKGGQAGVRLPGGWRLGANGVWADSVGGGPLRGGQNRLMGGIVEGDVGTFASLHGEYVVRNQRGFGSRTVERPDGHAGYANANLFLGRLQVLAEFKDLLRYDLPFVNPPTTVRQHATTLLNRATHVPNIRLGDERGGLFESYLRLSDQTRLTGSFSRSTARRSFQPAWEAYGEIEQHLGLFDVFLRAAETEENIIEGGDNIFFERITYSATVLLPVSSLWSLDLGFETQNTQESNRTRAQTTLPHRLRDNVASVTVSRAPMMSWGLNFEWTDDERETRESWMWAEWNVRVGDRNQVQFGAGNLRGGQVCSGGVCKLVKPFEGGRIEFLTTF